MADSFVFYKSFYNAIIRLPDTEQQAALFQAICRYALDGELPELGDPVLLAMFDLIKPQLDANEKRRTDGAKGAEYGKLGGRPRKKPYGVSDKNPSGVISENPSGVMTKTPNVNVNVNGNVNANGNVNVNESDGAKAPRTRHKYGQYENVLLTDEELEKLKKEFPFDWEERIERVSSYVAATGKKYKNFLATIRNWANRDKEKQKEEDGKWAVTPPEEQMPYPWEVE